MGQIITTQNLVATKVVRHAGQLVHLQQYGENIYTGCHKGTCAQISRGNTEWLLRYKGVS